MDLDEYDEEAALERALQESMQACDPEEDDLARALQLSEQEQMYFGGDDAPDSYADFMEAAIAASLEDSHRPAPVPAAPSKPNSVQITELAIPYGLVSAFKKLRFNLEYELGVKLSLFVDYQGVTKMRINHPDADMSAVAKVTLEGMLSTPEVVQARVDKLKDERVHVFVDHSNIFLCAQYMVNPGGKGRDSLKRDVNVRIKCIALGGLVEGSRNCVEKLVFGSIPAGDNQIWQSWEKLGYSVHVAERPPGAGEQFVDDAIIAQINNAVLKYPSPPHPRHTMVLLTGDGNDNSGRASFFSAVNQALFHGWRVELWTWRHAMSKKYLEVQECYGGSLGLFHIMYLDEYRDSITYKSNMGNMTNMPVAAPPSAKPSAAPAPQVMILQRNGSTAGKPKAAPALPAPALEDYAEEEANDLYNCPITCSVMQQPVVTKYGHIFEKDAIYKWIRTHFQCPITNMPLGVQDLKPAPKDFVDRLNKYKEQHNLFITVTTKRGK